MSSVQNPAEKKRLAYERDQYNRGGENNKAWRKSKPVKKAKARRAYRKTANDLTRTCVADETVPTAACRKLEGVRQRRIIDWGSMSLREFVISRQAGRECAIGARQERTAKADQSTEA